MMIGALSIPQFLPLKKQFKTYFKYGIVILIVIFVFTFNIPPASSLLKNAYGNPLQRINEEQVKVSEWLKDNIPEDQNVSIIGPPPDLMKKVFWMASYSHRTSHYFEGFLTWDTYKENRDQIIQGHLLNDYIVIDYSDIGKISDRSFIDQWQAFESQNLVNHSIVYQENLIRVYKYEAAN